MWALVCIAHLWIRFCFTFPLKARRGLQIQKFSRQNSAQGNTALSLTPCSVSHFWIFGNFNCLLCAVLVTFGFSENIRHFLKYHHMDPKFPRNCDFRKPIKFV